MRGLNSPPCPPPVLTVARHRQLLTLLLAAWSVALATGLPLPRWPKAIETTERFPCEACSCGCATAEYCWNHCCCHTVEQRIVWARREGVRPPAKVLAQAAAAGVDVSEWDATLIVAKPVKNASCCAEAAPSCCSTKASCCSSRVRCADQSVDANRNQRSAQRKLHKAPGVSLVKALACQGLLETWLTIGAAPVPDYVVLPEFADVGFAPIMISPTFCSVPSPPLNAAARKRDERYLLAQRAPGPSSPPASGTRR